MKARFEVEICGDLWGSAKQSKKGKRKRGGLSARERGHDGQTVCYRLSVA